MRLSLAAASIAAALTTIFACSSKETGGPSSGGLSDSGSSGDPDATGDGAVADGDGNVDPKDTAPPSKVNFSNETVDVGGTPRKYVLAVPKTYSASKKYPLIVALHGDGGNASNFQALLHMEEATGDDAIIAYEEGSVDLYTAYDQNDDQRLIELTIAAVKAKYSIDAAKIWGVGYSKGAFQLNQIACRKPGLLSAMAVHAGGAPEDRLPNGSVDCPNAIALPVFATEGGNDSGIGGQFAAQYWAGKAGCGSTLSAATPAICNKYNGCPASNPVYICIVPGQPHYPLYDDAAAHSWAWFKSLQ